MGLGIWLKSKLRLRRKNVEENTIQALRKEIDSLRKENRILKEKVIVFPKKSNEKIPIEFVDENIEKVIIENIRKAKTELCIAVAWFTSNTLMDELSNAKRRGLYIKIIISDDKKNNRNIYKLMSVCDMVKTVVIPKIGMKDYKNLMHNKYCIIDNTKVIDGSYNWSNNAKYNLEHVIVIESKTVAKMYKDNFDKIYNNPEYYRDFSVYDELG